jgi:predicted hotdog family 3-hydroxylacyl-ACP dehydratase
MELYCDDMSRLVPHSGAMCLLDRVETWDADHIVCRATSHLRPDNPLRDNSGLRALCAIEYGAQAIAAHAALLGRGHGHGVTEGVLASLRHVTTTLSHLDELKGALTILATLQLTHQQGRIYDVTVTGDGRTVLTGRLSVMLAPDDLEGSTPVSQEGAA